MLSLDTSVPFRKESMPSLRLPPLRLAALAALGALALAPAARASDPARGISQVKLTYRGDPATSLVVSWRDGAGAGAGTVAAVPAPADPAGCPAAAGCVGATAVRNVLGTSEGPAYAFYQAELTGLRPGTSYRYRVSDGAGPSATYTFRTAAGPGNDFTAAAVGEVHIGDTVQPGWPVPALKPLTDQILASGAEFTLSTGDNINTGATESEWERMFGANPTFFGSQPYMTAVGNHETYGSFSRGLPQPFFFAAFPQPTNGPDANGRSYSYDYNGVHFAVVEANPETPRATFDAQLSWLKQDLADARSRTRYQVVIDHSPPFHSKASRVTPYENPEFREGLVPIMDRYGVEMVISGHDKHYVRSFPLRGRRDPGATPSIAPTPVRPGRGTTYVELTSTGQYYTDFLRQNWMERAVPKTAAFLRLDFSRRGIGARAIQPDGQEIDAFTVPHVK